MKGVAGAAAIVVSVIGITVLAVRIASAASAAPLPLAYGFDGSSGWQNGEIKPHDIYFGAGGNLLVRGLTWTSWGQDGATATGARWADSCRPDCAAGRYARVRAVLTLSRVRVHHGVRYFSELTLRWVAAGQRQVTVFRWIPGAIKSAPPSWL
jgi:hypothetical protein